MGCPNFNIKEEAEIFNDLAVAFGEPMAYFFYEVNQGYPLSKDKSGNNLKLFDDILKLKSVNGDVKKATKIMGNVIVGQYSNAETSDNLPTQLEFDFNPPSIEEVKVNLTTSDLADSSTNVYQGKTLTISEYEALPYKDYQIAKIHKFVSKSEAEAAAARTGGRIIESVDKRRTLYKLIVSKPNDSKADDYAVSEDEATSTLKDEDLPENIQEIVSNKRNRIRVLKNRLIRKSPRASQIRQSISTLENQIEKIKEDHSDDSIVRVAMSDFRTIENNLDKVAERLEDSDLSDEDLSSLMNVLSENSHNIKGWINVSNLINSTDKKLRAQTAFVQDRLLIQNERYNDLTADVYLRYINQKTYRNDFTKDKILAAVEDISRYRASVHSIGESDIPLLQTVDDLLKNSADNANNDLIKRNGEIKNWIDKLVKHTGKSRDEVSKMFLQYNEKGDWTGNYVGRYSQKFFDTKREKAKEASESDNWKEYFKWINDNTIELPLDHLNKINDTAIEDLDAIGTFSKEEVLKQKKLLNDYAADKKAQIEGMFISGGYSELGTLDEVDGNLVYNSENEDLRREFYTELNAWMDIYSPVRYLETSGVGRKGKKGTDYIINNQPMEEWHDLSYKEIERDPVLYEFYRYMKDTFNKNNESMPHFNFLQDNYLPEMEKSLLDMVKDNGGLLNSFSLLSDELKSSITDEAVKNKNSRPEIGGKEIMEIPIYMMENKLLTSYKESDIFKVLGEHSKTAINYKYKAEIEPMVNAASDLLDTVGEMKSDESDGTKPRKGKLNNSKDSLNFAIKAYLYNNTQEVEGRTGITFDIKNSKGEVETRELTFSNMADNMNTLTYLKQMSFPNVISPTVNAAFGITQNIIYASSNRDVSAKEMNKALLEMTTMFSQRAGEKLSKKKAMKVYAFMDRFKLIGDIHDASTKNRSFTEIATLFQSKAEFYNQGSLMLAMLRTEKLKDKNGKEVTVFDAYTEKNGELFWNTELMGEQKEVSSNRIFSENRDQVNLNSLGNHIDAVNKIVHGDYKNTMMIKNKAVWRMVMLYKRWLPQAIDYRFGKERLNKDLLAADGTRGRVTKGRYLSLFNAKTTENLELKRKEIGLMFLKGLVTKSAFNDLSAVDKENLIRTVREIQFTAMLAGAVAMLQVLFGDDDDGDSFALKMAINTLSKTQADMMFFFDPSSMGQVVNNMIPALSTVEDLIRVTVSIQKTLSGNPRYETGPWKDYNRIMVNSMKVIPGASGVVKLYNYGSRIYEYN